MDELRERNLLPRTGRKVTVKDGEKVTEAYAIELMNPHVN